MTDASSNQSRGGLQRDCCSPFSLTPTISVCAFLQAIANSRIHSTGDRWAGNPGKRDGWVCGDFLYLSIPTAIEVRQKCFSYQCAERETTSYLHRITHFYILNKRNSLFERVAKGDVKLRISNKGDIFQSLFLCKITFGAQFVLFTYNFPMWVYGYILGIGNWSFFVWLHAQRPRSVCSNPSLPRTS